MWPGDSGRCAFSAGKVKAGRAQHARQRWRCGEIRHLQPSTLAMPAHMDATRRFMVELFFRRSGCVCRTVEAGEAVPDEAAAPDEDRAARGQRITSVGREKAADAEWSAIDRDVT